MNLTHFLILLLFYFKVNVVSTNAIPTSTESFENAAATPATEQTSIQQPGCDNGTLFSPEQNECFHPNEQGPCGQLMKFIPDPANIKHGYCDCDDFDLDHNNCTFRPKFFWPDAGRCFYGYERGPCMLNEWLVLNGSASYFQPICVPNPCLRQINANANSNSTSTNPENHFWFDFVGNCYQTGTQGFCSDSKYKIYLRPGTLEPLCVADSSCGDCIKAAVEVVTQECDGSRGKRYVGNCRKKITFDFPFSGAALQNFTSI